MGRHKMEVSKPTINFSTLDNLKSFTPIYHNAEDTFFLRPDKPRLATSVDWNGEFWIRIDPKTSEVVGLEIEDFESIFLKKYPEVAKSWEEIKPLCCRKRTKESESLLETFIRIIIQFLFSLLRINPQKASFNIAPANL